MQVELNDKQAARCCHHLPTGYQGEDKAILYKLEIINSLSASYQSWHLEIQYIKSGQELLISSNESRPGANPLSFSSNMYKETYWL